LTILHGSYILDVMAKDFVAEIIAERTRKNPEFPQLVAEAEARRKLARRLASIRERRALSQTVVAARMGTSASVVSKLEAGGYIKMSTFQRYCAAIGETVTLVSTPASRIAR
jgi:ribosome-binding protein aMBF1 (putative translation factor)